MLERVITLDKNDLLKKIHMIARVTFLESVIFTLLFRVSSRREQVNRLRFASNGIVLNATNEVVGGVTILRHIEVTSPVMSGVAHRLGSPQ